MRRHRLLTLLLLTATLSAMAQNEFQIKSFEHRPDRVIPSADRRYDLDKDPCALVIVQAGDDIVSVEGNFMKSPDSSIPDIPRKGMEQWVYLTTGTKKFRLLFKNHYSLDIDCAAFGIKELTGNTAYLLTLYDPHQTEAKRDTASTGLTKVGTGSSAVSGTTPTPAVQKKSDEKTATFGIRAGLNMATTQFASPHEETSMTTSFHVGLALDLRLSSMFYFSTGLYYSGKGYKYDDGKVAETATAQYIDLPLQAALRFTLSDAFALQVNAGPYIAMGLGGSIKDDKAGKYDVPFFDHFGSFDYGVQTGLSFIISRHITVGAAYQIGMGDYRNRNIGLSVGYNF